MTTGTATLQRAMELFGPEFMAGQKKGILASVGQSAVSSGLSGTTRPGAVSAGMITDLETTRRTKLAGLMDELARMQSQEQMEAERLNLSKAALALDQARLEQQGQFGRAQLKLQAAEQAPSSQWMRGVSPATITHQQGVARRMSGGGMTGRTVGRGARLTLGPGRYGQGFFRGFGS